MCRSSESDPLIVGLTVGRELHHKRWAHFVDLIVLLLSAGLAAAYIITALTARPDTLVSVDYEELLAEGKPLFEHFCVCNVTTLRWATFTTYNQYADSALAVDDDSGWCDTTFSVVAGDSGRVICGTAVYKIGALLNPSNSTWTISSDTVISETTLRATLAQKVRDITFDAWNTLSDSMLITQLLIDGGFARGHLSGNRTGFDEWTESAYADFLKVEVQLPKLNLRILGTSSSNGTMYYDNDAYIRQCQPRSCKKSIPSPVVTLMIAAAAIIGSYISLFTAVGNILLKMREKGHVNELVAKWRAKTITRSELDFLRFNYPKFADDIASENEPHGGVAEMGHIIGNEGPPAGAFGHSVSVQQQQVHSPSSM